MMRIETKTRNGVTFHYVTSGRLWWRRVHFKAPNLKTAQRYLSTRHGE